MPLYAKVLYSYNASSNDELNLVAGDKIELIPQVENEDEEDNWLYARNLHGEIGLVPGNYIERILPKSWTKLTDPETNDPYYYNSITGKRMLIHLILSSLIIVYVIRCNSMGISTRWRVEIPIY
jgi:hypothetical protein